MIPKIMRDGRYKSIERMVNMFDTIMNRISVYNTEKDGYPHWKKTDEYIDIFNSIRKAFYADSICFEEYSVLMDALDID